MFIRRYFNSLHDLLLVCMIGSACFLLSCGSDSAANDVYVHHEDTIKADTIKPDTIPVDSTVFKSFSLVGSKGESKVFLVDDSTLHIKTPNGEKLNIMTPFFELYGRSRAFVDSTEIISGKTKIDFEDLISPVKLRIETSDGRSKEWRVVLYDLPVLLINTPDSTPITSTKIRTEGCQMSLVQEDGRIIDLGTAGIKGRGSSSWEQPKKPYNIKLDHKHELLGMKSSKHWILLANAYFDRTQLHNATAFEMARLTDYSWVQSGTFVELIFNGVHQGLYYLCEKIRIEKGKIEITEIQPTDLEGENLTGGYLIESAVATEMNLSKFFMTDFYNKTGRKFGYLLGWRPKHPDADDILPEQFNYLRESLNHVEKLIWDEDSLKEGIYRKYFDIETAINWWLVQEATLNEEATRSKNIYMYKDRGGKYMIGPPWDFDAWTFGLYGTSHFYCTKTALYYENLLKDPFFINRLKEKWAFYKPIWLDKIPKFIDDQYQLIKRAALRNDKMWPNFCPETMADTKTYEQNVMEMKDAFIKQIEWMDHSIQNNYFVDWWDENDWPPSQR